MAKRREMTEKEREAAWKALPQADKHFLFIVATIAEAMGDEDVQYWRLPTPLERTVHKLDRDGLFRVAVECVGLLLDAPALQRLQKGYWVPDTETPHGEQPQNGGTARPGCAKRKPKKSRAK